MCEILESEFKIKSWIKSKFKIKRWIKSKFCFPLKYRPYFYKTNNIIINKNFCIIPSRNQSKLTQLLKCNCFKWYLSSAF